ncbi:MAG: LamG domain-containing protein [Candidatus Paceibacterota bacterium]
MKNQIKNSNTSQNVQNPILNKRGVFSVFLFSFLVFGTFPFSVDAGVIVKAPNNLGLVGYWPMSEGTGTQAGDHSGNGNDGTLQNTPTWVSGKLGTALNFDGSDTDNNQTVTVSVGSTNPELAILGDVTISAWIKPSSAYFDTSQAVLRVGQGADLDYSLFYDPTDQEVYFHWYDGSFKLVSSDVANSVPFGDWSHVIIVRSGTTLSFYVDGAFLSSGTVTAPTVNAGTLAIGRTNNVSVPQDYSGSVDEMRIYNRALSVSEVHDLYNSGLVQVGKTPTLSDISGLVGHWTFDGKHMDNGVEDASGNGNTGVLFGQSATTTVAGKIGQALEFDGVDDYVTVSNASLLNPVTSLTVSVWVKIRVLDEYQEIVSKGSCNGGFFNDTFFLCVHTAGSSVILGSTYDGGGSYVTRTVGIDNEELNQWIYLTGVIDTVNDKISLYKNGSLASQTDYTNNILTNADPLRIGGSGGVYLDGDIDDVRIYDRALSNDEIKRIYNATRPGAVNKSRRDSLTDGLVGFWTFDGPDMLNGVEDVSGNGNTGVISGQTSTTTTIGKIGQALSFDGVDDYVLIQDGVGGTPSSIDVYDEDHTITAWIKLSETLGGVGSCCNDRVTVFYRNAWQPGLWLDGDQIRGHTRTSSGGEYVDVSWTQDQEWHLVGQQWDKAADEMRIILDGEVLDGTETDYSGNSTDGGFYIGEQGTSGFNFPGAIDNFRIYNRKLTEAEIQRLYQMGR